MFATGRLLDLSRMGRMLAGTSLLLVGCVQFEMGEEGPGAGDEAPASTQAPGGEETTGTPTTGEDPTTGEEPTGGAGSAQCDLWEQDCPLGSKCAPYDEDNDGIHDTARCAVIEGTPGQEGDVCMIEGGVASGLDNCDIGLLCWNADAQNKGWCVEMCSGSKLEPICSDARICDISNGGALPLCVTPCDPLTPSCSTGQICLPGGDNQFICDVDASGDQGGYGDACAFVNVCDQGLLCVSGTGVPGCVTDGCCTEYCDLSAKDFVCAGAPAQECVSFYDGDTAPPGYELVGVCTIPS